MNDVQNVQQLLRDTIAGAQVDSVSFFEDGDILADDGLKRDAIENRLASRGFAVSCDYPVMAKVVRRAPNVNQCEAVFPVVVSFNVEQNAIGAQKNILQTFDVIASTILGYAGNDPTDRFEFANDAMDLLVNDAGMVKYVLWIFAQINLAATN